MKKGGKGVNDPPWSLAKVMEISRISWYSEDDVAASRASGIHLTAISLHTKWIDIG